MIDNWLSLFLFHFALLLVFVFSLNLRWSNASKEFFFSLPRQIDFECNRTDIDSFVFSLFFFVRLHSSSSSSSSYHLWPHVYLCALFFIKVFFHVKIQHRLALETNRTITIKYRTIEIKHQSNFIFNENKQQLNQMRHLLNLEMNFVWIRVWFQTFSLSLLFQKLKNNHVFLHFHRIRFWLLFKRSFIRRRPTKIVDQALEQFKTFKWPIAIKHHAFSLKAIRMQWNLTFQAKTASKASTVSIPR